MKKIRCPICKKNTSLIGFECKCMPNKKFCTRHRNTCTCSGDTLICETHKDGHRCSFDWKKYNKEKLIKENPKIIAQKIKQF